MTDSAVKKILIFGWSAFIGTIICRHSAILRDAIVGTFPIVVAICIGGFIAITTFLINFVDNIHQKLGDFVEKVDGGKLNVAQTSLTKLKREILQNMCFFSVLGIAAIFLKKLPASFLNNLTQVVTILLLGFTAFDQVKAINTCMELRELVIRKK